MAEVAIERVHSYAAIERLRHELSAMPSSWLADIRDVKWVVYPDDLSPLFTGLLMHESFTHDGRNLSECGGWYSPADCWESGLKEEHIFLDHASTQSAVHEAAHALYYRWHVDMSDFYKDGILAFGWYMASNEREYFACALDYFLRPGRDNTTWNGDDLAGVNPGLYSYLMVKLGAVDGKGR